MLISVYHLMQNISVIFTRIAFSFGVDVRCVTSHCFVEKMFIYGIIIKAEQDENIFH